MAFNPKCTCQILWPDFQLKNKISLQEGFVFWFGYDLDILQEGANISRTDDDQTKDTEVRNQKQRFSKMLIIFFFFSFFHRKLPGRVRLLSDQGRELYCTIGTVNILCADTRF